MHSRNEATATGPKVEQDRQFDFRVYKEPNRILSTRQSTACQSLR